MARASARAEYPRKTTAEQADRRLGELLSRLANRDAVSTTYAPRKRGAAAHFHYEGTAAEMLRLVQSIRDALDADRWLAGELGEFRMNAYDDNGGLVAFVQWSSC